MVTAAVVAAAVATKGRAGNRHTAATLIVQLTAQKRIGELMIV